MSSAESAGSNESPTLTDKKLKIAPAEIRCKPSLEHQRLRRLVAQIPQTWLLAILGKGKFFLSLFSHAPAFAVLGFDNILGVILLWNVG